ncbi:transposase [Streptomyces sp. NPDC087901]|uniref:transposase n=1 Tax=Streptomyces sp. NPDC087901 TaxID=3365818 RepID=UPI00382EE020
MANRPVHVALAVSMLDDWHILGLRGGDHSESAKPLLSILTAIKNRGVGNVGMLICDGLEGLHDACRDGLGRRDGPEFRWASFWSDSRYGIRPAQVGLHQELRYRLVRSPTPVKSIGDLQQLLGLRLRCGPSVPCRDGTGPARPVEALRRAMWP